MTRHTRATPANLRNFAGTTAAVKHPQPTGVAELLCEQYQRVMEGTREAFDRAEERMWHVPMGTDERVTVEEVHILDEAARRQLTRRSPH